MPQSIRSKQNRRAVFDPANPLLQDRVAAATIFAMEIQGHRDLKKIRQVSPGKAFQATQNTDFFV